MPNLIGSNISKAEEFCKSHNMTLNKEYVDAGQAHYNSKVAAGLIGDQSISIGTLLANVSSLTIYIPNASPTPSKEPENNNETTKEENKENNEKQDESQEKEINDLTENFNIN